MIEERFTELVNLYLDREIQSEELEALKQELRLNVEHRREFESRVRLHRAVLMALDPNFKESDLPIDFGPVARLQAARLSRFVIGGGLAACFLLGLVLYPVLDRVFGEILSDDLKFAEQAPFLEPQNLSVSDLRRYIANQSNASEEGRFYASTLAAHFRLLGLSPDISSPEKDLEGVNLADLRREVEQNKRLVEQMIALSGDLPNPQTSVLRSSVIEIREESLAGTDAEWLGGFGSSLASFRY